MKQSKLEEYLAIVNLVLLHGPIELRRLQSFVGISRNKLRKDLDFLVEQNVVKIQPSGKLPAYVATSCGTRIVKYFGLNVKMEKHPKN
jgi:predicted transcriptional regulator